MAEQDATPTTDGAAKALPAAIKSASDTPATGPDKDPIRDVLQRMERVIPTIEGTDREFAKHLTLLTQQSADPERLKQPGFRHEVAYALQDLERITAGRLDLQPSIRSEMTTFAASTPGLENERMMNLMRQTAALSDPSLVREIRAHARDIATQKVQDGPDSNSRIDVLENKLRLTPRPPEPAPSAPQQQPTAPPQHISAAGEQRADARQPTQAAQAPLAEADARATQQARGAQQTQPIMVAGTPLDRIFSAMRPTEKASAAPWDPAPTPMRDRLSAFEKTMQDGKDDQTVQRVERMGRAAIEALQGFSAGEGATVMNRIREAAKSEPGGMTAVLSEMREGGRFADLRGQFNNALFDERGVSASYDRAAAALAKYGDNRPAVEQILARRPDATNLSNKFEQMDAAIGEAASNIPSRKDGKAMIEDLAKLASDLLHRAVDAVRSVFARTPEAGARPNSPAP